MPPSNKPAQSSPFEIVTPGRSKKIGKTGIIVGVSIVVFLILSVVAGVLLVKQQQNISEQAATIAPTPTDTATPTPTVTPTVTPTATPTFTPTPTATSSSAGNSCNGTCGSNSNCESGLYCYSGFCRNPLCASDSTCGCSSASPTATASATPTITPIGTQTTPRPIPVSGTDWPTMVGVVVGVGAIIVSFLLAL